MTASRSPGDSVDDAPREPAVDPAVDSARTSAWARAEGHALATASLLDDPSVPPWTAAMHLRAGWAALLAAATDGADPTTPLDDPARLEAVADAIEAGALPWIDPPRPIADALRALPVRDDAPADLALLRRLGADLALAVTRAADERFAPTRRAERRRTRWRRGALLLAVLVPVSVFLVLTVPDYREGPWRGEYFGTPDLTGDPILRRDGDVHFDWANMSPKPELPADHFSVRWDTCLVLDEDLQVAFQLISDDGSRLLVDGVEVVDNWGQHGERSRGADVAVSAGVHHLRVEYFDERHSASVELRASLHGELPASLPVRILRYPGDELDPNAPCGAVTGP